MNIKCSHCPEEHALFRYINKNGRATVMYRCNRFPKLVGKESRITSTMIVASDHVLETMKPVDWKNLPEVWSDKWAKKMQGQKQQQLVMFYDRK